VPYAAALYALIGLAAGALANWLADIAPAAWLRDRERARLLGDRRACARCGQLTRRGLESGLVRLLLRRGRCPNCEARLPWRPVVVELAAALAFGYLWLHDIAPAALHGGQASAPRLVLDSIYVWVLLLVTVTDLEHRLILDAVMLPAIAFAALAGLFASQPGWPSAALGGLVGFVFFFLAAVAGQAIFGSGALGWGDVTLAAFIGLITGFPLVIVALVLGILVGGAVTGLLLVVRLRSLHSTVPYGPFLVAGGLATLLWGPQIVYWYFNR
jgi:leader peptidase (prepilin peptidase)/N-methyltransferase